MKRIDMTEGKPFKLLVAFTLPSLAGNLLNQVYTITDTLIVGRYLGQTSLAAIGVCMPIILLVATLIIGTNIGVSIILSQKVGQKDEAGMRKVFANSLYLAGIISLFTIMVGLPLAKPMLKLIGTPEGPLEQAASYMKINFITTVCPMLYFLLNNIFKGMGDSVSALYVLIASVISNIFLDILFVAGFNWGVAGSAWATALAQAMSVIVAFILLYKKFPNMRLSKEELKPDKEIITNVAKIAVPIALQSSFNNLGNIIVQSCINGFGEAVMAAYTAASRIGTISLMPNESVGSSLSVYTGQNVGAKKHERIKEGMKDAFKLDCITSISLALVMVFFGKGIISLFIKDANGAVMSAAYSYLLIAAVPGILQGIMLIFQETLKGMGQATKSVIGGFMQLGGKVLVALIGAYIFKSVSVVWLAWPLSFILGTIYPALVINKEIEKLS